MCIRDRHLLKLRLGNSELLPHQRARTGKDRWSVRRDHVLNTVEGRGRVVLGHQNLRESIQESLNGVRARHVEPGDGGEVGEGRGNGLGGGDDHQGGKAVRKADQLTAPDVHQ